MKVSNSVKKKVRKERKKKGRKIVRKKVERKVRMEGNIGKERNAVSPELCVFASISISQRTQHLHNCVQRKLHLNKVISYHPIIFTVLRCSVV